MDWENFNAKKYRMLVHIGMPVIAFLLILLLVVLPIIFFQTALQKEAEKKGTEVHKLINWELF